ncbi:hypothetical protein DPMN_122072 [Dreissena polymorpha]|uniref:Dedicator of cytokinesis TPR repeats region domain-containing protein n=1 Tax=Dreissena polymorpha TaxID=45954 RepID=A0A9D4JQ69_DREPO|nr:hypothetical protein DPMN_122072 [Dreissena polymorpha]
MRVLMGVQVETLWQSLGVLRRNFMPALMGPFLQLTLVPAVEVRKATLPIIFDMMACEQKVHGHFNIVCGLKSSCSQNCICSSFMFIFCILLLIF